jgi:hypothetical protein
MEDQDAWGEYDYSDYYSNCWGILELAHIFNDALKLEGSDFMSSDFFNDVYQYNYFMCNDEARKRLREWTSRSQLVLAITKPSHIFIDLLDPPQERRDDVIDLTQDSSDGISDNELLDLRANGSDNHKKRKCPECRRYYMDRNHDEVIEFSPNSPLGHL